MYSGEFFHHICRAQELSSLRRGAALRVRKTERTCVGAACYARIVTCEVRISTPAPRNAIPRADTRSAPTEILPNKYFLVLYKRLFKSGGIVADIL